MKHEKTQMSMHMDHGSEFTKDNIPVIPVDIRVRGFLFTEDATRIFDQITKSVECVDALLHKPVDKKKPADNQFAWVEIDESGDLEVAKYNSLDNSWYDFANEEHGNVAGNRVRVHQLIKTPKFNKTRDRKNDQ